MRTRILSNLYLIVLLTTACQSVKPTATPSQIPTDTSVVVTATTQIASPIPATSIPVTSSPTPHPPTQTVPLNPTPSVVYPPPGGLTGGAKKPTFSGLNSALLLKDMSQGQSIMAYYDPELWSAGPTDSLNDSWTGQTLSSRTLAGCILRFSGGLDPNPSWQSESVSVSLNPEVTLYEIFKQSGAEVLRLYRAGSYDSAFAVRLDSIDVSQQSQCIEQIEKILGSIVIQTVYP